MPYEKKLNLGEYWHYLGNGQSLETIAYRTEEPYPKIDNDRWGTGEMPQPVSAIWLTGDYAGTKYCEWEDYSDCENILIAPTIAKIPSSGVGSVADDPEPESDIIYNLSGRRVSSDNLQPGIYIRNHRKFIVR